jgi:hypothetical protein
MSAAALSSVPAGPRRADVAAAYDLGVDTYASLWSPVIRPSPGRSWPRSGCRARPACLTSARDRGAGGYRPGQPGDHRRVVHGRGLEPHRIWLERLTHRWEPSTYWRLVTGTGANRARLLLADEDGRAALLATARPRLEALDPEDFAWWCEVICAVASKPG